MLKKEIGSRLRKLRTLHEESLRDLASRIGVNYSTLHKIEKGENYPSIEVLDKLADRYNVPRSYFFGETQEVPEEYRDRIQWIAFGEEMRKYNLTPEEIKEMLDGFLKHLNKP